MRAPLLFVFALGCGDDSLKVLRNPPAVVIQNPYDNAQFAYGDLVTFEGVVDDDSPPEELTVEWISSIDGPLPDFDPPDPDGNVELSTASLSTGTHVVTLRAIDPSNEQAEDEVIITVMEVPELPSITVDQPTGDARGLQDQEFVFMATVDDYQDPPENLLVTLEGSGGFICDMQVDGGGNAQCAATLPVGSYLLSFTVEDSDGNEAEALAEFDVLSPDDYDFDNDGYSVNGGDCNDSNATIYPGAPELCDGLDNDCNELTAIDVGTVCYDDDGDNYCEIPPCVNTSQTLSDCDDTNASISPVGTEVQNGLDDDCDGFADENTPVYDDDGDGFCESPPCINASGTLPDCDDGDYTVNPAATEICHNGVDNNCNGVLNEQNAIGCSRFYYDNDGDTYGVAGATQCWCDTGSFPYTGIDSTDCYDNNANANPRQTGWFSAHRGDGSYDYDCSGSEERRYTGVTGGCSWGTISGISCNVNGSGWSGSVPSCGGSGNYVDDCDASYDAVCYALCLLSSDPISCLISTCGASCNPDYSSFAQTCR